MSGRVHLKVLLGVVLQTVFMNIDVKSEKKECREGKQGVGGQRT